MKIAFILYWTGFGGGPAVAKSVCQELAKTNEVILILVYSGREDGGIQEFASTLEGVSVQSLRCMPLFTYPYRSARDRFRKIFSNLDVAYFFRWRGGLEAFLSSMQKELHIPIVCGYHSSLGVRNEIFSVRRIYDFFFGKDIGRFEKSFFASHALNKITSEKLEASGIRNVYMIHNGIEQFPEQGLTKVPSALILGRLQPEKGLKNLEQFSRTLLEQEREITITVIGTGSMESFVRALSVKSRNIRYLGYLNEDSKIENLERTFCILCLNTTEAFFLAGLEGMMAGSPLVTLENPGVLEYVENGANGFICKDVDELGEKVLYLYRLFRDEPEKYEEMGRNARKTGSRFRWDSVAHQYEEMFGDVISKFKGKS